MFPIYSNSFCVLKGLFRYCKNMEVMWRFRLGPFLKIMWGFLTPLFTLVLIVFTIMTYEDLTYNRTYKYPSWALKFGWILSISSFICIPVYAIYKWILTSGSFTEVRNNKSFILICLKRNAYLIKMNVEIFQIESEPFEITSIGHISSSPSSSQKANKRLAK